MEVCNWFKIRAATPGLQKSRPPWMEAKVILDVPVCYRLVIIHSSDVEWIILLADLPCFSSLSPLSQGSCRCTCPMGRICTSPLWTCPVSGCKSFSLTCCLQQLLLLLLILPLSAKSRTIYWVPLWGMLLVSRQLSGLCAMEVRQFWVMCED